MNTLMKIKKLLSLALVAVLAICMLTTAASAALVYPPDSDADNFVFYTYYCTGDAVNHREGPGANYSSFGYLWKNDTVLAARYNGVLYTQNGFAFGFAMSGALREAAGGIVLGWTSGSYLKSA